jgi:hypothetical protein
MKKTAAFLSGTALALAVMTLGGCLLTVGSPLARKVEPDSLVVEAGGGGTMLGSGAAFGGVGYAYVGRSIGKHFEIGFLPAFAAVGGGVPPGWSITIPFRWDPVAYDAPLHPIVFGGPSVMVLDGTLGAIVLGAGLSWTPVKWLDAYAALSLPVSGDPQSLTYVTASAGARFPVLPSFELGAGLTWTYPAVFTAMVSGTIRTKPLLAGYGF